MKLWLDDVRQCPFIGNWKTAKNFDEAVKIMEENEIEEAWLDHDLAIEHYVNGYNPEKYTEKYTEKTGYDFVLWMKENNKWPTKVCMVHSMNPIGAERMCSIIAEHYGTQTPLKHYISFKKLCNMFQTTFKD